MPNYRVTITVNDVADGDVAHLRDEILNEHGDNFDASRGDFRIEVTKQDEQTGHWFPWDSDDDA